MTSHLAYLIFNMVPSGQCSKAFMEEILIFFIFLCTEKTRTGHF